MVPSGCAREVSESKVELDGDGAPAALPAAGSCASGPVSPSETLLLLLLLVVLEASLLLALLLLLLLVVVVLVLLVELGRGGAWAATLGPLGAWKKALKQVAMTAAWRSRRASGQAARVAWRSHLWARATISFKARARTCGRLDASLACNQQPPEAQTTRGSDHQRHSKEQPQ